MNTSVQSAQSTPKIEPSSLVSLLERGLNYAWHGNYTEAAAFFSLVRELLTPNQVDLAAMLDALSKSYASYSQARQSLYDSNKRFVEADTEHLAQLATLEKLLPDLREEASSRLLSVSDSPKYTEVFPSTVPEHSTSDSLPALYFTCFGHFEVRRNGQLIILCSNRKGQALLRYLIAQPEHRASTDILMSALWPDTLTDVARHKLQVAISALRCSLNKGYNSEPGGGYILCNNRTYLLNPAVSLQTDVGEFLAFYQAGRQSTGRAMVIQYEKACRLYTGPFLTEDLYADWSFIRRDQLHQTYLMICGSLVEYYLEAGSYEDAIKWAKAILKENLCDEAAHRYLIRAYALSRRRSEALQQYKRCQSVLFTELGVQPTPETMNLFYAIQSDEYHPKETKNSTKSESIRDR